MENTFEKVQDILVERLEIDKSEVRRESSFKEDLDADSLDVVELVMEIEDTFGVEIADDEAGKLTTVQDVVTYIDQKLQ